MNDGFLFEIHMDLKDLGYDYWFEQHLDQSGLRGHCVARVTEVDRDRFIVTNKTRSVPAELTGRLMYLSESGEDLPCVGDWVVVQYYDQGTLAIIHHLLPRKSFLRRKSAGENSAVQMIAANIDIAFIVQSCDADFSVRRLDRYLVMARDGNIEPVLLLTKRDLVDASELEMKISQVKTDSPTLRVIALSNVTGLGLDELRQALEKGTTYCLLGSSGVGKTTLLNRLLDQEVLPTSTVREKDGKGRHTTSRRHLIVLENGAMFVDTPGMREMGMIGMRTGIEESFTDITELVKNCRYRNCTHTMEPGCAILDAVSRGEVAEERYRSYLKLLRESEYHALSYVEKRRKDKDFGRFVKSVMKHHKKK
jgi:ribosome biogenesis GTPase